MVINPLSQSVDQWLDLAHLLDPGEMFQDELNLAEFEEVQWQTLYIFACKHWVIPTLHALLNERDQLKVLPADLQEAIAALAELNEIRNEIHRQILHETAQHLNAAGITPIPLKGSIALLPGQYPHAFTRMLGDLDLLVRKERLAEGLHVLLDHGYQLDTNYSDLNTYMHHAPPLWHPSKEGYVELHSQLLASEFGLPITQDVIIQSKRLEWQGVQLAVPSLEHRLIHNSLHHLLQDGAYYTDRRSLRQLLEFAQLRLLGEPTRGASCSVIDWHNILSQLSKPLFRDAFLLQLRASGYLFGLPWPALIEQSRRADSIENRFWLRMTDPIYERKVIRRAQIVHHLHRLQMLPMRVATPLWYREKWKQLLKRYRL